MATWVSTAVSRARWSPVRRSVSCADAGRCQRFGRVENAQQHFADHRHLHRDHAPLGHAAHRLRRASLQNAPLSHADLSYAVLTSAKLNNADLSGANLTGATLTKAVLTGAKLAGVQWSSTTCPDGTNSDAVGYSCSGHHLSTVAYSIPPTVVTGPECLVAVYRVRPWPSVLAGSALIAIGVLLLELARAPRRRRSRPQTS